ncbi:very-long-chain (3R)-3-hydroxyacyl-CoA dehydratase 2 [Rhincodon typus]|uniref:very-long-chain (3R)-3-hydroxyacyl-CoA dehydratase 2 n=1 Tax=Rhincodon typus TaxID=259920 RepID=UPI00202F00F7|nr:very-long-chain (3R)-3-hydroxyacyl-CoA dehydratase 2 [Rhincodon typus]
MASVGSGVEHQRGVHEGPQRKRRGPGPLATAYMVIYNVVMTAGWLVIAVGLIRAGLARGTYHGLYYSIEKPLKFFQTGALLEILHCAVGIVPSSFVLTGFQVMSRVFLTWAVTHSVKQVQSEDSVLLFVTAWTLAEIVRYSFYTFSLLNHLPYVIKWAR